MRSRHPTGTVLLLAAPSVIAILIALVLMNWRTPTRIRGGVTVSRVAVSVGGESPLPLSTALAFRSLTVERFSRIALTAGVLRMAGPAAYDVASDAFSEEGWLPLPPGDRVLMPGADVFHPAVTVEPVHPNRRGGVIDRLWVRPGDRVMLEVTRSGVVIAVDGGQPEAHVSSRAPMRIHASHVRLDAAPPGERTSATYEVALPEQSPILSVVGREDSLLLVVRPMETEQAMFGAGGIPVTALDFTRQRENGERTTSLLGAAALAYPDEDGRTLELAPNDLLRLDALDRFRIDGVTWAPEAGLVVHFDGIAGVIASGPPGLVADARRTQFDRLWRNQGLVALAGIVLWIFPTTIGGYQLFRQLQGR